MTMRAQGLSTAGASCCWTTITLKTAEDLLEPFRKELEVAGIACDSLNGTDLEVPHVEAGTSSDRRPARLALRE